MLLAMKKLKEEIWLFFKNLCDYSLLYKSFREVFWLTFLAFLPILINIIIASIVDNEILIAIKSKIVPGEIIPLCLSFLIPTIYLLTKPNETGYNLPYIQALFFISLLIYVCSVVLYLIAKNNWIEQLNNSGDGVPLYLTLALFFLFLTAIFRIYTVYHTNNLTYYNNLRKMQQEKVTQNLKDSIG